MIPCYYRDDRIRSALQFPVKASRRLWSLIAPNLKNLKRPRAARTPRHHILRGFVSCDSRQGSHRVSSSRVRVGFGSLTFRSRNRDPPCLRCTKHLLRNPAHRCQYDLSMYRTRFGVSSVANRYMMDSHVQNRKCLFTVAAKGTVQELPRQIPLQQLPPHRTRPNST